MEKIKTGAVEREYGAEQPYIGGPLKLRLPFIHYRIEYQDFVQGAILSCVPLGITAAMVSVLGIPIEVAVLMVVINNFLYLLHTSFGDPAVAGWITAGIPLYIAYLEGFAAGPDRIRALVAYQIIVGLMFLIFGITGIATKLVQHFPVSMRAGVLLGAGFASLMRIFSPAQPFFGKTPISFIISAWASFFILFSSRATTFRAKYGLFAWIASFGIAPGFVVGYAVGLFTGEIPFPKGIFHKLLIAAPFETMLGDFSAVGLGMPSMSMWVGGISLAIVAYILAFGDVLVFKALVDEGNRARPDENVVVGVTRNQVITAIRNLLEGVTLPYLPLCGPQWTGGQALVINRFKQETPKGEPSYWGGATSIFWGMSIAMVFHPIVQIILPAKDIGFGLTLLIQGYLCIYLAFAMCETNVQRGVAGCMGAALVTANFVKLWHSAFWSGATVGLIVGAVLYFSLEYVPKAKKSSTEQK
jgi:hypothetical protein